MSEIVQTSPIVSLTCGASVVLYRLLQSAGWNKTPKEKFASGKIQEQLEKVIELAPEAVAFHPSAPEFTAAQQKFQKGQTAWERSGAEPLELTEYRFQAVQTCLKYHTSKEDTGSNRYLAELQEAFRVTE